MRSRDLLYFIQSFRQADVECPLSFTNRFPQKLKRQGGFPRSGSALDQIKSSTRQPAVEHIIESPYSRHTFRIPRRPLFLH